MEAGTSFSARRSQRPRLTARKLRGERRIHHGGNVLGKVLMLSGGILLLGAWLVRTFLFERWNRRLADIRSSRSDYFVYQSNNALFSALAITLPEERGSELWDVQNRNYESGLEHLRQALSEVRRSQLNARISQKASDFPYNRMGDHAQRAAEVVVVQEELLDEKQEIETKEQGAEKVVWLFYAVGSIVLLVGSFLQA